MKSVGELVMTEGVVERNLLHVQEQIVPCKPRIIAVTKYYDTSAIVEAYNAGLRDFGEARINDAIKKIESLDSDIRDSSCFHFIGHLQTNKVDKVVRYFDYIHSVDSLHLAQAVSKSAQKYNKLQKILLQVNISREVQKFGFDENELIEVFGKVKELQNISIEGLMCMAPFEADEMTLNSVFSRCKFLKNLLNEKYEMTMEELSMGMSDDYVNAVRNGATMIRIGKVLFNL